MAFRNVQSLRNEFSVRPPRKADLLSIKICDVDALNATLIYLAMGYFTRVGFLSHSWALLAFRASGHQALLAILARTSFKMAS